jgi:hypothetical protein
MAKITESQLRNIIKEELKKLLEFSEAQDNFLLQARNMGNPDFANKLADLFKATDEKKAIGIALELFQMTNKLDNKFYLLYKNASDTHQFADSLPDRSTHDEQGRTREDALFFPRERSVGQSHSNLTSRNLGSSRARGPY